MKLKRNTAKLNLQDVNKSTYEIVNSIKQFLPTNYLSIIHKRINSKITLRQIRYVINGNQNDYHHVIDTLIDIATEEKKKREAIFKRLNNFKK